MKHLKIALVLLITPLIILNSCGGGGNKYVTVTLNNPSPYVPITPATTPAKYVGFQLIITVKSISASGAATTFSNYIFNYPSATSVPAFFTQSLIQIPASGSYTVEYSLQALDCSLYTTTCSSNKGKNSYREVKTFNNLVSTVNFTVTSLQVYSVICC